MFKVNEYFDGEVASIGFQGEKLPATVGVMAIGEYAFDTSQHETMTVVSGGRCGVQAKGSSRNRLSLYLWLKALYLQLKARQQAPQGN